METGQPLTADDLQMTMTPGQSAQIAETARHNGVMESRPTGGSSGSGGGGSSNGGVGKYIEIPGVGTVTVNEGYNLLAKAEGKDVETTDEFGMTKTVKGQRNDDLVKLLRPLLIPGASGGGGQQTYDTDEDWYSAKFADLVSKGFTEEQAYARMDDIINGK